MAQQVKNLLAMQETQEVRVQSLGRGDSPGGGNGIPLQYSCLGNPTDRVAWKATVLTPWTVAFQATVHGVKKNKF